MQIEESINTTTTTHSKSELWNLSLRDIFYKYVRFLPLFVLSVAFSLLIAYLYLRYAVPIYSVSGSMTIRSESPNQQQDELTKLMTGNQSNNIMNEIEVLRSRPLMERVVDSLNLEWSYTAKGKIKTVNIYNQGPFYVEALKLVDSVNSFGFKIKFLNENEFRINDDKTVVSFGRIFQNDFGQFRLVHKTGMSVSKEYGVKWTPPATAASIYAGMIGVAPKAGTQTLYISMRTTNAKMGSDIINWLMKEYGAYSVEQKNLASIQKLDFIDARLAYYRHKIDSSQAVLNAFERANNLIDPKHQSDINFDIISTADKELNDLTIKLEVINILNNNLTDKRRIYDQVSPTLNIVDPALTELVIQYNKSQVTRQQLLDANIPINNPTVKAAGDMVEKYRSSIQDFLKTLRTSLTSSINSIKSKSSKSQGQLTQLPEKVKDQLQMTRAIEQLTTLRSFLESEREKQAIIKVANVSDSKIVNSAYPTTVPVKPNRRAIQMLAILLGIGLPALIIFLSEILNDKVSTRFDIEKITTTPILGEIGHSYSDKVMVVNKTTRSMVAEQFRIIRSNLQYVLNKKEKATILFTSSFSGEGKSYVTTNMGAVLALAGKKTVILEFDIRKPKILSGLGMPKGPGITNFLIGKAELADLIKPVPDTENLFVLGCGPIPPNPSELLLDKKMDEMFAWLKENFDIVLVDTAPVGMVSDAMTLSKYADSTLYLVRQGHTFKRQVGLIDEFYKEEKLPRVSIIINDVKIKPGYGYYGYGRYGYGYGYGYGSYYEEEVAPRNFVERAIAWLDIRRFFGKPVKKKSRRR